MKIKLCNDWYVFFRGGGGGGIMTKHEMVPGEKLKHQFTNLFMVANSHYQPS